MIQVSKYELAILRQKFPELVYSKTVHKYYTPERPVVLMFLRKLRNHPEKYEIR